MPRYASGPSNPSTCVSQYTPLSEKYMSGIQTIKMQQDECGWTWMSRDAFVDGAMVDELPSQQVLATRDNQAYNQVLMNVRAYAHARKCFLLESMCSVHVAAE